MSVPPPSTLPGPFDRILADSELMWQLLNTRNTKDAAVVLGSSVSCTHGGRAFSEGYVIMPHYCSPSDPMVTPLIMLVFAHRLDEPFLGWASQLIKSETVDPTRLTNILGQTCMEICVTSGYLEGIRAAWHKQYPAPLVSKCLFLALVHDQPAAFHELAALSTLGMHVIVTYKHSRGNIPILLRYLITCPALKNSVRLWEALMNEDTLKMVIGHYLMEAIGDLSTLNANRELVEHLLLDTGIFGPLWERHSNKPDHADAGKPEPPNLICKYAGEGFVWMIRLLAEVALPKLYREQRPGVSDTEITIRVNMELSAIGPSGLTPLETAVSCDMDEVVAYLLGRERLDVMDINRYRTEMYNGQWRSHTILHRAIFCNGRPEVHAKLLFGCEEVNVNLAPEGGHTALIDAISHGKEDMVGLLAECPRIDVNAGKRPAASPFGAPVTPLEFAIRRLRVRSVAYLLQRDDLDPNGTGAAFPGQDEVATTTTTIQKDLMAFDIYVLLLDDGRWNPALQKFSQRWIKGLKDMHLAILLDDQRFRDRMMKDHALGTLVWNHAGEQNTTPMTCRIISTLPHSYAESMIGAEEADKVSAEHALRMHPSLRRTVLQRQWGLIISYVDGLLRLSGGDSTEAGRYFRLVARLPIELQMIVALRTAGIPLRTTISREVTDKGIQWMEQTYARMEKAKKHAAAL
jgi:hypothetical protein